MPDRNDVTLKDLKAVLVFVLPQITSRSQPTVAAGYSPAFPGDLLQEQINPAELGDSPSFGSILELRTAAHMA